MTETFETTVHRSTIALCCCQLLW